MLKQIVASTHLFVVIEHKLNIQTIINNTCQQMLIKNLQMSC